MAARYLEILYENAWKREDVIKVNFFTRLLLYVYVSNSTAKSTPWKLKPVIRVKFRTNQNTNPKVWYVLAFRLSHISRKHENLLQGSAPWLWASMSTRKKKKNCVQTFWLTQILSALLYATHTCNHFQLGAFTQIIGPLSNIEAQVDGSKQIAYKNISWLKKMKHEISDFFKERYDAK